MKKLFVILSILMGAASMEAKDMRTIVFTTTPQMHCQNCENRIKDNIRFEKGVKLIVTSVPDQTVKVTYDADKTTPEKLKAGFKKIGYDVRPVKEDEKVEIIRTKIISSH